MAELVDRYVHQVGRYLPPQEREEVEAELRSLIQDQLEDRFPGPPSQTDIATVLTELGDPRQMAASYGSQQYLIGPDLYPTMMRVLRLGWIRLPIAIVLFNAIWSLSTSPEGTLLGFFFETLYATLLALLIFSAVVVLVFASMQRSGKAIDEQKQTFNPLDLPAKDDPRMVDYVEMAFGLSFGVFFIAVCIYFLQVGGLTLRFNVNDPGKVIPVPKEWLILLIVNSSALNLLNLLALWRNRWTASMWLIQLVMEMIGVVCLYFVLYEPLFERINREHASLDHLHWIPVAVGVINGLFMLVTEGPTLIKLLTYESKLSLAAHPSTNLKGLEK